jgi:hypothetical protein
VVPVSARAGAPVVRLRRVPATLVALAGFLATGCTLDTRTEDLLGVWYGRDGRPLPAANPIVVRSERAGGSCDGVVVLILAWPVGSSAPDPSVGTRRYARDPDGLLSSVSRGRFAADVRLSSAAFDTGFQRLGNRISVEPDGDAYVTRPAGQVERWPRIDALPC